MSFLTPGWALLAFFVLGWSYYMVSTILMEGSIFVGLRMYIGKKASDGSKFFGFFRSMLGCMMCTATEASLWTLGIASFIVCVRYGLIEAFIGQQTSLFPEVILSACVAFALSLAISGEAWAIKMVVENNDRKFLKLREEFRTRESELLDRIADLEKNRGNEYRFEFIDLEEGDD